MTCRHIGFALALAGFLCVSPATYGQDLSALQANFTAEIDALNSRNLEATLSQIHDNMVLFGLFSPFPIKGKDGFRQAVQEYFADYDQAVFSPINPKFNIAGTTGVAWGNFRLATRQKDGQASYSFGQYLFTSTQADGQWRIVSMHYSLIEPPR